MSDFRRIPLAVSASAFCVIGLMMIRFGPVSHAQPTPPQNGIYLGNPPGGSGGACTSPVGYLYLGTIYTCQSGTWTATGGGGGGSGFNALTSGTNTTATMHVGTGAALNATGSGTLAATTAAALASAPSLCSTGYAPTGVLASGNATGCAAIGGGGGGSQNIIGSANFTISGGTIMAPTYTGVVTGVTYASVGHYVLALSGVSAATYNAFIQFGDASNVGMLTILAYNTTAMTFQNCNPGCSAFQDSAYNFIIITQ